MEIKQFKLLDLTRNAESELVAKLEINRIVKDIKIEVKHFDGDFYGFQMPEDIQVVLRNYPRLSQKIIGCLSDFLNRESLHFPIDFSLLARRQNIAVHQPEKQAA